MARLTALERSKTTLQPPVGVRPDAATILAARRAQSVSNPANVPPPPPFAPNLSRSNTSLGRNNTARVTRNGTINAGIMPLRVKTPQGTAAGIAGMGAGTGADSSRVAEESGAAAGGAPTTLRRPSLRRPKGQGTPPVPQQLPQTFQSGQYMNDTQGATSFVLPAAPAPVQGGGCNSILKSSHEDSELTAFCLEGHLTQFYNTYMEAYTDDQTSRPAIPRPPTAQAQSSASSPAAASFYQQPQPQPQEQQQLPAWMQSAPSPVRSSSNTSASSGMSRAPSRAANASMMNANMGMMNMEPVMGMNQNMGANMGKGGLNNAGGGTLRRKVTRRPTTRRVTMYDDEDGDDGFVTGEYEEFEMANIRVKVCPCVWFKGTRK